MSKPFLLLESLTSFRGQEYKKGGEGRGQCGGGAKGTKNYYHLLSGAPAGLQMEREKNSLSLKILFVIGNFLYPEVDP